MDKLSSKIFVKFTVFLPPGIFHNFFTGMRPRLFCIFHIFNISLWKIFLASHPAAFKYCSLLSKKSIKELHFERIVGIIIVSGPTGLPYAPVAQLDRALDSDSKGRAFESHRAYHGSR